MPEMTWKEIARLTGGTIVGAASNRLVKDYHFDSRLATPDSLFFAMKSARDDGHRYVRQLPAAAGVGAVVAEHFNEHVPGIPLLRVGDPRQAALALAAHVRQSLPETAFIAVTGSAGKTTTKEFIYQILSRQLSSFRSFMSWNNALGVPFSLLKMKGGERTAVFELAMSDPGIGEIDLLAGLLRPQVAVILNVLPVHLEFLKSIDNVALAKAEILNHPQPGATAFINGDMALLREAVRRKDGWRKIFFGSRPEGNDVVLEEINPANGGLCFRVRCGRSVSDFAVPALASRVQVENLVPAIAVARHLGLAEASIQDALAALEPIAGRGVVKHCRGFTIIDETYNSNPEALKKALAWVDRDFAEPKIAVLGDMLELGEDELDYHRQVGCFLAGLGFSLLAVVGERAHAIAAAAAGAGFAPQRIHRFAAAAEAGQFLRQAAPPRAAVLFKASRGVCLEKALSEFCRE